MARGGTSKAWALAAGIWVVLALAATPWAASRSATVDVGDTSRAYDIFVPAQVQGPAPVVIMLHGGGGGPANAVRMTGWSDLAAKKGFVVVYPAGSGRFPRMANMKTWNATHCCAYAMEHQVDDIAFLAALVDQLVAQGVADPKRVYLTGMSNGAMLTLQAAAALGTKVAAAAPVVGAVFGDEPTPKAPVPFLIINGGVDDRVPPSGGALGGRVNKAGDGTPFLPAEAQGAMWAKTNGCAPTPQETATALVTTWTYTCPAGQDVVRYLVQDNGHAWPGGQKGSLEGETPSTALDATRVIWNFFQAHHR